MSADATGYARRVRNGDESKPNARKSSWLAAGEPDFRAEWGREDSNLRRLSRRVYSPFPLAARAHPLGASIVAVLS